MACRSRLGDAETVVMSHLAVCITLTQRLVRDHVQGASSLLPPLKTAYVEAKTTWTGLKNGD